MAAYDLVEPVLEGDNLKPFDFVNKVVAKVTPQALKNKETNLNADKINYEEDNDTRGMFVESARTNTKKYRDGKTYSRLSSTFEENMCWFASFLTAVSDTYNIYNLTDQIEITRAFREYCRQHVDEIKAAFPEKMAASEIYKDAFTSLERTLNTPKKELEKNEGFIIAWYFGFNNVFVLVMKDNSVVPDAYTAYQSEDCPVVIFYFIEIGAVGHYEILCVRKDGAPLTFDTWFEWKDKRLCDLKEKFKTCNKEAFSEDIIAPWLCDWTLPKCDGPVEEDPFPTFNGTESPVPSPEGSVDGNSNNSNSIGSSAFEFDSNAGSNNGSNGSVSPEPNTPEEEPNTPGGNNLRKLYGNKDNIEEEPEKPKGSINNFVAPGEVPENFYKNNGNKTPKGSVNNFVAPGEVPENFYKNNNNQTRKNNVSKLRIGVPKGENNNRNNLTLSPNANLAVSPPSPNEEITPVTPNSNSNTNKNKQVFLLKEVKGLKPAEKEELLNFLNPNGMPKLTIDTSIKNILARGRKVSRTLHPNRGGNEEKFKRFRELLDLLASLNKTNLKFLEDGSIVQNLNEPIAKPAGLKPTSFNNNSNTRVAFGPTQTRRNKNKKNSNNNGNNTTEFNVTKVAKPSGPNPKKALENKLRASAEAAKARSAAPKRWQVTNQGVTHRGESAPGLAGSTALPSSNMLRGTAAAARKTRRRKNRKTSPRSRK